MLGAEEGWEDGLVMGRWAMFSHIVGFVGDTWAPVDQELALFDAVLDPIKMHANGLRAFLFDFNVGEADGGGIVVFFGCGGLGVTYLFKGDMEWASIALIY